MSGDVTAADRSRYEGAKRVLGDKMPTLDTWLAASDRMGGFDQVVAAIARGENLDDGHTPSADGKPQPMGEMLIEHGYELGSGDPTFAQYAAFTPEEVRIVTAWLDSNPKLSDRMLLREQWASAVAEGTDRRRRLAEEKARENDVEWNIRVNAERVLVGAGQLDEAQFIDALASSGLIAVSDSSAIFELTRLGGELVSGRELDRLNTFNANHERVDGFRQGYTLAGVQVQRKV